jgi:hypothetical protein
MRIKFRLPESHGPRYRARVGTCQLGYMIPFRLPWRPRARPSATLHEIPVSSKKSQLGIRYYRRPSGLSSGFSPLADFHRRDAECAEKFS